MQPMVTEASTQHSKGSQIQMEDEGEPSGITKSISDKVHICNHPTPFHMSKTTALVNHSY